MLEANICTAESERGKRTEVEEENVGWLYAYLRLCWFVRVLNFITYYTESRHFSLQNHEKSIKSRRTGLLHDATDGGNATESHGAMGEPQ